MLPIKFGFRINSFDSWIKSETIICSVQFKDVKSREVWCLGENSKKYVESLKLFEY